jgi:hypothetical protein
MERNIKMTIEQAKQIYKDQPEMRELLLTTFTKEELEAFSNTQKIIVTEAMRERLTQEVMKELLNPKPDEGQERMRVGSNGITSIGTAQGAWGNGLTTNALYQSAQAQQALVATNSMGQATLIAPSLTIGNTTITEAELKQMLATRNGANK